MQVKNLTNHDITFMYSSTKSTEKMPVFDTVNIVAGWTVDIPSSVWEQIKLQEKTVCGFTEEVQQITSGGAYVRSTGGDKSYPTKTIRQWDGTTKTVNLVDDMIANHEIEVLGEFDSEPELPDRSVLESFLKRFNVKLVEKMTDEEVIAKTKEIKQELAALYTI